MEKGKLKKKKLFENLSFHTFNFNIENNWPALSEEQIVSRELLTVKKCKSAILLNCNRTAGVLQA